jgi:hypothetical protein
LEVEEVEEEELEVEELDEEEELEESLSLIERMILPDASRLSSSL